MIKQPNAGEAEPQESLDFTATFWAEHPHLVATTDRELKFAQAIIEQRRLRFVAEAALVSLREQQAKLIKAIANTHVAAGDSQPTDVWDAAKWRVFNEAVRFVANLRESRSADGAPAGMTSKSAERNADDAAPQSLSAAGSSPADSLPLLALREPSAPGVKGVKHD